MKTPEPVIHHMVEVFKTSVTSPETAAELIALLLGILPGAEINFDLEDCDNILRINTRGNNSPLVIQLLNQQGYLCEELK